MCLIYSLDNTAFMYVTPRLTLTNNNARATHLHRLAAERQDDGVWVVLLCVDKEGGWDVLGLEDVQHSSHVLHVGPVIKSEGQDLCMWRGKHRSTSNNDGVQAKKTRIRSHRLDLPGWVAMPPSNSCIKNTWSNVLLFAGAVAVSPSQLVAS